MYQKKFEGIFRFFEALFFQVQQRWRKDVAKMAQRPAQRCLTLMKKLQRWTRPHWEYIILILPVWTRPSLQRFLEVKSIFAAIFADLCKDLQRRCKDAKKEHFLEFYGGVGY